jgi:hypothetical protein
LHEPSQALQKRPFLAFLGCRQGWGNYIWRAWLWGQCRQPNAARLHPAGLVGPETRTKCTLKDRRAPPGPAATSSPSSRPVCAARTSSARMAARTLRPSPCTPHSTSMAPQHHPETFRTPRIWGPRRRLHGTQADVARGPPRRPRSWSRQLQAREPRFGSSHVWRGKGRWVAGGVGRRGGGRELAEGGGEPAAAMEGDGMPPPSITQAQSETGSRKRILGALDESKERECFFTAGDRQSNIEKGIKQHELHLGARATHLNPNQTRS